MRSLTDVLTEARRLARYGAVMDTDADPTTQILAETCRILAAAADPDRLPYGERRVSLLVDEILGALDAPVRTRMPEPVAVDVLAGK